ncbi:haloacid dehalogenase [Longispora fulva]|uniref:Putative hydrolase of the HAD superfamily n=1 Tax=Longispora fulva TaxID=619741 RepID=A0A8J7GBE8_9ACTN|nr:HAD family hydrolase [Longispora fulva]MBG6137343.1 putative hydrolase of the HAD superfamily [Longispora fulva]GIG61303.1 haloacid dehalogenase [Longispora fulva]
MTLIRGILLDLEDTLYPRAQFLDQAWQRVCAVGSTAGLDPARLRPALDRAAAGGSDRPGLIDEAIRSIGADLALVPRLVYAFREYWPTTLVPYPGVDERLDELSARLPLVLVTDGNPAQQRAKIEATGLARHFRAVVCTDEGGGRDFRKPHGSGFRRGLSALACAADATIMIGDRPDKDVAGASSMGIRSVRVRCGEHAGMPDHPATWRTVDSTVDALDVVLGLTVAQV